MTKVYHVVSNKEWGGGEQYVYDLCCRQLDDGMSVGLFCRPIDNVINPFRNILDNVVELRLKGVMDVVSAFKMARVLAHAGPCILHAHNFKDAFTTAYARKLSGNKEVRIVLCRHLTRAGKNTIIYRWLYRQLDVLYFGSQLSKQVFLSTHPHIDEGKLHVVHPGTPLPPTVELAAIRSELGINDTEVLAMYHGRLAAEKGLDILVESVASISEKNFRLVLIGRGSDEYTNHLKQLIAERKLQKKILLLGFRHPVLPYVAAADFGILASTVAEGCGLSLQEYMSQGHPVVTTDNGGQRDFVFDNRNGLLVPPGNSVELAMALSRLIDDGALRRRLGQQAAADFNENLNYEKFYQQIKNLYVGNA